LLLEEPLSALDAKVRAQLRDEIRRIQKDVGITTLFVTHDQEEALSIADQVGIMSNGKLQQLGTPAEVYEQPQNAFVAEFVGSVNRLPGILVDGRTVEVLGHRLPVPPSQDDVGTARELDVLLRPEAIRLQPDDQGSAVVTARSFLGAMMRVVALLPGGGEVTAVLPAIEGAMLASGTTVTVTPVGAPLFVTPRVQE
jgi:putative spermidine/putrescine transport system ATP-binding protein